MARAPNTAPLACFAGHVPRTLADVTNWLREARNDGTARKTMRGVSMCI
jgi:hypothetical protein